MTPGRGRRAAGRRHNRCLFLRRTELLNKLTTGGVQVNYRFADTRPVRARLDGHRAHPLTNNGLEDSGEIKVGGKEEVEWWYGCPRVPRRNLNSAPEQSSAQL